MASPRLPGIGRSGDIGPCRQKGRAAEQASSQRTNSWKAISLWRLLSDHDDCSSIPLLPTCTTPALSSGEIPVIRQRPSASDNKTVLSSSTPQILLDTGPCDVLKVNGRRLGRIGRSRPPGSTHAEHDSYLSYTISWLSVRTCLRYTISHHAQLPPSLITHALGFSHFRIFLSATYISHRPSIRNYIGCLPRARSNPPWLSHTKWPPYTTRA